MSRLDTKKVLVEDLNKIAQEAFSVIAVDYRGTNVPGLTQLRKEAKSQSVQLKVIKNTLATVSYTHLTLPTICSV